MQSDLEVSQKQAILLDLRCADGLEGIVGVPGKKAPRYICKPGTLNLQQACVDPLLTKR